MLGWIDRAGDIQSYTMMSARGTSRNLAATQHLGRFRSEADIASDMDHDDAPGR